MVQKVFTSNESTNRSQTLTVTIPNLKAVSSVAVNTGSANITSVEGDIVKIALSGGSYSSRVQTGGSYTSGSSKTVTDTRMAASIPSSISYSSGGYTGTLYLVSSQPDNSNLGLIIGKYSGTVTKPAVDTRTYTSYYQYRVTVTYEDNSLPQVTVTSPLNNLTLYENDIFNIAGTASDADTGDTVTVRYQINATITRAIKAFLSDGLTPEAFSKSLTFKGGNLYDGTTLIAENLSDGVAHTLKVWSTDDQGGTSTIREISFFVVPNRAPLLTVNSPVIDGLINSDKFKISGTFEDPDGNTTIVSYRINGSTSVQIAEGVSGPFTFKVAFGQLVIGENQIVVEAIDSYGAKVSKTIKLNKNEVKTEQLRSTARYKINPPTGSARGVLLWIQRDENLNIDAAISMTMVGEAETFVPLTVSNSAPLDQGSPIVEDEFYHEADGAKDNIILQIDIERASLEVSDKIYLISGVLD